MSHASSRPAPQPNTIILSTPITHHYATPNSPFSHSSPRSYLDAEQRLIAARVIKRFILHTRKSAFIVEHDFIMATYMADKVVVCVPPPRHQCGVRVALRDDLSCDCLLFCRVTVCCCRYEGTPGIDCTASSPQVRGGGGEEGGMACV